MFRFVDHHRLTWALNHSDLLLIHLCITAGVLYCYKEPDHSWTHQIHVFARREMLSLTPTLTLTPFNSREQASHVMRCRYAESVLRRTCITSLCHYTYQVTDTASISSLREPSSAQPSRDVSGNDQIGARGWSDLFRGNMRPSRTTCKRLRTT